MLKSKCNFFISFPFGKKKIYKNLQQFDSTDLKKIYKIFHNFKKKIIFYNYFNGKWRLCNESECKNIEPIVKKNDNQFVLSAKSIALIKFNK